MDQALHKTPLHTWHLSHGGKLVGFAQYELPVHYGSIVNEHHACRSKAVLFDVSHMGRLRFDGKAAGSLLDYLLSRSVSTMPTGAVRYALICNAEGGVLDDVLVSKLEAPSSSEPYYLMVVNAANRQRIKRWLEPHLNDTPDVVCTDRTELTAMIALQGPAAVAIADRLTDGAASRLKYYRATFSEMFGKPVILSRTGYTGEDGVEWIVRSEDAIRVWENLLLAGREVGAMAAGLGARDTLRLEAAMPLYGHELSEQVNPLEAGLSFAVELTALASGQARSFIGGDALRTVIGAGGPTRVRVGLKIEGRRPARETAAVLAPDGTAIGVVTSGSPAPSLDCCVAMAYVPVAYATKGSTLAVDIRGSHVAATVVPLPFYKRA
jgi:aminomethyltransferase